MEPERRISLDEIRALLAASEGIRFTGWNRKEIYNWVRQAVTEQRYDVQGRAEKGVLRRNIAKMTGLSRAQVTRLIGQYRKTGKVEERVYRRRRFCRAAGQRPLEPNEMCYILREGSLVNEDGDACAIGAYADVDRVLQWAKELGDDRLVIQQCWQRGPSDADVSLSNGSLILLRSPKSREKGRRWILM